MTDVPIIFSGPMVRAWLDGRKTMTRRLAWREARGLASKVVSTSWQKVKPGDRLWVRENFAQNANQLSADRMDTTIVYAADNAGRALDNGSEKPWTSCIHMPRILSRLTLIVTATKIEPLQAISADDAEAEGIEIHGPDVAIYREYADVNAEARRRYDAFRVNQFRKLWQSLHGEDGWSSNPEVVAITARAIKANIDAPDAIAA